MATKLSDYDRREWWTIEEAADYMRSTKGSLSQWISKGVFTAQDGLRRGVVGDRILIHGPILRRRMMDGTLMKGPTLIREGTTETATAKMDQEGEIGLNAEMGELMTVAECAELLKVKPMTIRKLIRDPKAREIVERLRGVTRINYAMLRKLMQAGELAGKRGGIRTGSRKLRTQAPSAAPLFDFTDQISGDGAPGEPVFDAALSLEGALNQ